MRIFNCMKSGEHPKWSKEMARDVGSVLSYYKENMNCRYWIHTIILPTRMVRQAVYTNNTSPWSMQCIRRENGIVMILSTKHPGLIITENCFHLHMLQ